MGRVVIASPSGYLGGEVICGGGGADLTKGKVMHNVDIPYCTHAACPFEDCKRHLFHIKDLQDKYVNVADLSGICRDYIGYVVDTLCSEKHDC